MAKFLTKQEIIDKLNSLPDLPVIYRTGMEEWIQAVSITSIEVVDVERHSIHEGIYTINDKDWHPINQNSQKVILISC